ncbi:hypothetical protein LUZ62_062076 [Rhynchospora pubera]|uniref:Uncharacterized protein n=1 Tax=Rhynchospora pubera TaxID=906938 RepID=A0AAV8E130_9POAL|nr:hypothetical protein LUZ62_058201 [Rhynchospora pubera]KAJ4777819.1 hypothetical protein LUZ62_062076 [Rhynchospora pubera]
MEQAYSSHPKIRRDTVKDKKKAMAKCFFPSINKKNTPVDKLQQGRLISREEEDGVVKVKIVVTKKELKHLIAAMNQRENNARRRQTTAPQSFEQLFNLLRRKREKKQEVMKSRQGGWQPALQSIPEEM